MHLDEPGHQVVALPILVTASRLLICDFDGHVIVGDGPPEATAFYIHAGLHKLLRRAKVGFHTYMPNATALCLLDGPQLLWLGHTAQNFYGGTLSTSATTDWPSTSRKVTASPRR
ncbi:ribulose-5-phosphate 4-epimerase/fuculose-1-phosphate aldolase [Paraburkholderia youngii]